MKFIFGVIAGIILAFAALIGVGYFLPAQQTLERTVRVNGYAEDVFPLVNDLTLYSEWSLRSVYGDTVDIAFGGPASGMGQTAAWHTNVEPIIAGTHEIIESQHSEFVRSILNENGILQAQTFALSDSGEGQLSVLLRTERDLGGFPFLGRIAAKISEGKVIKEQDDLLNHFKIMANESFAKQTPEAAL